MSGADATLEVSRRQVLGFRLVRHRLSRDGATPSAPSDVELLDYGVQDSGPDGARWALAIRGAREAGPDELLLAWTLRGAPHAYRRADAAAVAVATAPLSDADAASRIADASKPLTGEGIAVLDALATVATTMRDIVAAPMAKGEVSTALTGRLAPPFLRRCRPCATTHLYEQPFRLAALQAGLELVPGTSPPVLRRIEGLTPPLYRHPGVEADARFDVIRNHLRFFGPARSDDVAAFLDAPRRVVEAHWPADAVPVRLRDAEQRKARPRFVLAADVDELLAGADGMGTGVRLLGPFDPYLQLRDRDLLVADEALRRELWRILGRPGAVLDRGELRGTWRPRTSGRKLQVAVTAWAALSAPTRRAVEAEAQRLAEQRGVTLSGVTFD